PSVDAATAGVSDEHSPPPSDALFVNPMAERPVAAEPSHQPLAGPEKQSVEKHAETNSSIRKSSSATAPLAAKAIGMQRNVRQESSSSGICTEAVAALALCSPDTTDASK